MKVFTPEYYERTTSFWNEHGIAGIFSADLLIENTTTIGENSLSTILVDLVSTVSVLIPYLWLFAAWGAFRELNEVGRVRSAIVLAVVLVLSVPVGLGLLLWSV